MVPSLHKVNVLASDFHRRGVFLDVPDLSIGIEIVVEKPWILGKRYHLSLDQSVRYSIDILSLSEHTTR